MSHSSQRRRFEHAGRGTRPRWRGGDDYGAERGCPICGAGERHAHCKPSAYRAIDEAHARNAEFGSNALADESRQSEEARLLVGLELLARYDRFQVPE